MFDRRVRWPSGRITLPAGRYTVTVHLTQGGHALGAVTRTIALW